MSKCAPASALGPSRRSRLVMSAVALILAGCVSAPRETALATLRAHGEVTSDFRLTRPVATLRGDRLVLRGQMCRRFNSIELSPHRLVVTGYDAAGHVLFRQVTGVTPLLVRTDDTCHAYAADAPAAPLPAEVEVRMVPYGASAP